MGITGGFTTYSRRSPRPPCTGVLKAADFSRRSEELMPPPRWIDRSIRKGAAGEETLKGLVRGSSKSGAFCYFRSGFASITLRVRLRAPC